MSKNEMDLDDWGVLDNASIHLQTFSHVERSMQAVYVLRGVDSDLSSVRRARLMVCMCFAKPFLPPCFFRRAAADFFPISDAVIVISVVCS
jgi:hypothetical protein